MRQLLKKFLHPLRGLYIGFSYDRGIQFQLLFLIVTTPLIFVTFRPLATTELALLILGYGLLFVTEFQNTALEKALDHLHPEHHKYMRDSKDIAASSVLLSLLVFIGLLLVLTLGRG